VELPSRHRIALWSKVVGGACFFVAGARAHIKRTGGNVRVPSLGIIAKCMPLRGLPAEGHRISAGVHIESKWPSTTVFFLFRMMLGQGSNLAII
jgi:hypothetical protein